MILVKKFREKFWDQITFMERKYNIYAKGTPIYTSLSEEEFQRSWKDLNNLVSIFTEVNRDDLSYEEIVAS